ncbi:hypothetical protein ACEPAF_3923 [Sanghuangporus sanghuang]
MSQSVNNAATKAVESGIYATERSKQEAKGYTQTTSALGSDIKRDAENKTSEVQTVASDAAEKAQQKFPETVAQTASTADVLQNKLSEKTNEAASEGKKDVEAAKATGNSYVEQAKTVGASVLATAEGYVQAGQNKLTQTAQSEGGGVVPTLAGAANSALGATKSALGYAQETLQPHVENARATVQPHVENAASTASSYAQSAADAAKPYVQSAKETVTSSTNAKGEKGKADVNSCNMHLRTDTDIKHRCICVKVSVTLDNPRSMLATARLRAVAPPSSFRGLFAHNARPPNAFPKYTRLKLQHVRRSSNFPRTPSFVPYFTKAKIPYRSFGRRILWTLPIAGGAALYLSQNKPLLLSSIFSSPYLIPVPPHKSDDEASESQPEAQLVINSPDEEDRSIRARIRRILNDWLWEPLFTARRFAYLLIIFVPVILTAPVVFFGTVEVRAGGERTGTLWWYNFLVRALQMAGPTFIKLAQWAASREDIFPTELCRRMGKLHSNGKPHSIRHTRRVIERVFQRPFEDVFEEFDEKPIGVGAIAQVYRATLRKDLIPPSYLNPRRQRPYGAHAFDPNVPFEPPPSVPSTTVAIKILHPRVVSYVARDLSIMRFFARLINLFPGMEWISLPEEVEVFGNMMAQQLDLRNEARNLRTFEYNFSQRKAAVSFPRPLMPFTSKDVLIEEYQNALSLEAFLRNGGGPYDKYIAELGLDAFLNMLLLDNFGHSDLHPGNIMIKFYKPSTRFLLKGMWASLWGTKQPEDPLHPSNIESDHDEDVANNLRGLIPDPPAWRRELNILSEQGYLAEIVFIDTGLITTLNDADRRNFLDLFHAIAEFDGYRAGQLMVERSRTPHLARDPETFALKMQHIVLRVKRKTFSLGQIKISDILIEVLRAVREHHVKLEADFVNTVIAVLLLEGIGRQLNPDLDLFKSALPILRKLGRQMTMQESMESVKELPRSDLGAYLKFWMWSEARTLASTAVGDIDNLVKYDLLVPNV